MAPAAGRCQPAAAGSARCRACQFRTLDDNWAAQRVPVGHVPVAPTWRRRPPVMHPTRQRLSLMAAALLVATFVAACEPNDGASAPTAAPATGGATEASMASPTEAAAAPATPPEVTIM